MKTQKFPSPAHHCRTVDRSLEKIRKSYMALVNYLTHRNLCDDCEFKCEQWRGLTALQKTIMACQSEIRSAIKNHNL